MGIVRLLIYGVKMSFPKRNLNNVLFIPMIFTNYSLDRFNKIKCVIVNFESVFYPNFTTKNEGFGPRFFGPRFKKRGPKMPKAPFFKNGA